MGVKLRWHTRKGRKSGKANQSALCGADIPLIAKHPFDVTCERCRAIRRRQAPKTGSGKSL